MDITSGGDVTEAKGVQEAKPKEFNYLKSKRSYGSIELTDVVEKTFSR